MFNDIKRYTGYIYVIVLIIFFVTLTYCSEDKNNPTVSNEADDSLTIEGYELIWNDEFNGSNIDNSKWEHEVNANGGGNNELQYYTARPENSFVEDGRLHIVAQQEEYSSEGQIRYYTSARMRTAEKGDWLYAKIDIRAKIPYGQGLWPAIWMLSTDWEYGGWPDSGEIDIMEHVGYDPNVVHASIHTKAYNHKIGTQKSANLKIPNATNNFHTYTVEWFEDHMDFLIDNVKYFTFLNENDGWERWPFDKRFHLLLNIAVGGSWGGAQGIDENAFPASMEIDFVRVYKKLD